VLLGFNFGSLEQIGKPKLREHLSLIMRDACAVHHRCCMGYIKSRYVGSPLNGSEVSEQYASFFFLLPGCDSSLINQDCISYGDGVYMRNELNVRVEPRISAKQKSSRRQLHVLAGVESRLFIHRVETQPASPTAVASRHLTFEGPTFAMALHNPSEIMHV
jgi:hypothetical protein